MGLFSKMIDALRGGANELGEAIVDSQGLRIMEQEIRDAKKAHTDAKTGLTSIMAEAKGVERRVSELKDSVAEHEGYATAALEKGDEALAMEVAEKIAEMESELATQEALHVEYKAKVSSLKTTIRSAENTISQLERELSMAKTQESVNKANAAVAAKFSGTDSSLAQASESLDRIKKRQRKQADQMKAAAELANEEQGGDLKAKLEAAGIGANKAAGSDILARLKAKKEEG